MVREAALVAVVPGDVHTDEGVDGDPVDAAVGVPEQTSDGPAPTPSPRRRGLRDAGRRRRPRGEGRSASVGR
jgi:hypothetical protein